MWFLDAWNALCLGICDPLLGWMLVLPTDVLLIALAILTSVLMTLIRRWTSDQTLLHKIADDKRRLRQLRREAKANNDRPALARLKLLGNRHALSSIGQEGKPLLWSIVPVAILATWAFMRVDVIPPAANQPITVHLLTRPTVANTLAHLVPGPGLNVNGPVQRLEAATVWNQACAKATWQVHAEAGDYTLTIRRGDELWEAPLLIGGRTYAPTLTTVGETSVHVDLPQRRLFGIVPGIQAIGFAPWLIGYLLLVIPLVFLIRPLLRTK